VKECRAGQNRKIGVGNGHGLSHGDTERGHTLAVAFGLGVLQVERAAQSFQRIVVGLFELRDRAGELGGALFH